MEVDSFNFKNYTLKISANPIPSKVAIIHFHGFPGEKNNGSQIEKNIDLAKHLCLTNNLDSFVPHYNGLGENIESAFSFVQSIEDSVDLCEKILLSYESIILIGHSWGGLVAINCFRLHCKKIAKMILMSPFTFFPEEGVLGPIIENLLVEVPPISQKKPLHEYMSELNKVKKCYGPSLVNKNLLDGRVLVLQAKKDLDIPAFLTESFIANNTSNCNYFEIDTDHSFTTNRQLLFEKCSEHLG